MLGFVRFVVKVGLTAGALVAAAWLCNLASTAAVIAGVVLAAAVGWFWVGRLRQYLRLRYQWPAMVLLLVLAAASANCATRVNAGNVGIKINYAGTYRGVQDVPIVTGWVVYWPGSSTVLEYPIYVQNVVWTHNVAEGNPVNEEITFTNADQMSIAVDVSLAYHLDGAKVPGFYMKFRNDDLSGFTMGFMRNVARDEFNAHGGNYHMDQIMGDNAKFIADVRASLAKDLDPYGVVLDQFGIIGSPRPPPSVVESIALKVKAGQITLQKQIEITQAEADANKEVAKASGYARSRAIAADADANYNRKVSESLTPTLVAAQTVVKWNGVLPQVSGSGGTLIQLPSNAK